MTELAIRLGARIRNLRRARKMTQEQLAETVNISVSFLSLIERGRRLPHVETLASLAEALNTTIAVLFTEEE